MESKKKSVEFDPTGRSRGWFGGKLLNLRGEGSPERRKQTSCPKEDRQQNGKDLVVIEERQNGSKKQAISGTKLRPNIQG